MSSDDWNTPSSVATPLFDFFGGPADVDPASNPRSIIRAHVAYHAGGLHLPWKRPNQRGRSTVFQNDPYSRAGIWTDKMVLELQKNVGELVRLSMASTSTGWWRKGCLETRLNPRIIFTKRLKFLDPDADQAGQERMSARFEPALWYYGRRVRAFEKTFAHITSWLSWGR